MTFKCLECGHIFPSCEVSHWREPHGEHMTGCPVCKCAFEEAVPCRQCGGEFLEDELYGGFCRDCLAESMTPASLLDYMMDNDLEWDFYTEHLFDREEAVRCLRKGFFRRLAVEAKEGRKDALGKCVAFVIDDDAGLGDYAQWYKAAK